MYFSIGEIKNDRAAQLAVVAANEFGERLAAEGPNVPFETVVCTLKGKLDRDLTVLAAQLLTQDDERKKNALKVGFAEIVRTFGGEENAINFFRQVTTPRAQIRFESVGGVQDDIHAAKNRSAVLAAKAVGERWRNPEQDGTTPGERSYIEFMKSVRRTLDHASESGAVNPDVAKALVTEIEEAAYTDQRPALRGKVMNLQVMASQELFAEKRAQVIQRYAQAMVSEKGHGHDDTPSMH